MLPMLRCARPSAPAPCAADDLLGLVSIEGCPADLAPVLTKLLMGHCGYLELRRLVLLRLKVWNGLLLFALALLLAWHWLPATCVFQLV